MRAMRRRRRGGGLYDWLNKAKALAQKHQLISRGAAALAPKAGAFSGIVGALGDYAGKAGYGRRRRRMAMTRRRRGGAMRLAGSGIGLAY